VYLGDFALSSVDFLTIISSAFVCRGNDAGGGHEGSSRGKASAEGTDARGNDESTWPGGGGCHRFVVSHHSSQANEAEP
jgi:hypothetical protein